MTEGQTLPFLSTKLHRPDAGSDYVPRPRLLERLNRNPHRALTLVTAPAGFGKTTLIAGWLADHKDPSAWLSIDDNDNTLPAFMGTLVSAIQTIFADAFPETIALLHAAHLAPAEVLLISFINEVVRLPRNFILALDDYHFVHDEAIHQFVMRVIRQRPRRLHLVLMTRVSPPFPLSAIRTAPMQVLEIRMGDLRFTADELRAFAERAIGNQLDAEALTVLEERTEGWAAGLRLAFLSLQNHPDPPAFLQAFQGASTYVMDYLMDQVISQQPADMVDMLLRTSILDRFCAPLCDALMGDQDGLPTTAFLKWIKRTNLFVTPLDERHEWLRYDHLFRELLLNRLQAQAGVGIMALLHRRASDWFAQHDLVDEAVQHAMQANDPVRAARVVERNVPAALTREDRAMLDRWLRVLPADVKHTRPALMIAQAWLQHFQGETARIDALLQQVGALMDAGQHDLADDMLRWAQGSVAALWGEFWFVENRLEQAIASSQHALETLPAAVLFERRTAVAYLCFAKQAAGQFDEAERLVADELAQAEAQTGAPASQLYLILCWLRLVTGDLQQLDPLAQRFLKQAQRSRLMHSLTWAHYFLGLLHYEWNDLETSTQHFKAIAEHRYSAHFFAAQEALLGLALIHQAQGAVEEAHETTVALAAFNLERVGEVTGKTQSAQARLAVTQGDIETAASRVRRVPLIVPDRPIPLIDEPTTTLARVLIATRTDDSLRQARQLLDGIHQLALTTHNARRLIEVYALQALALNALGQAQAALDVLQQAIVLAQPGGFIRMFVDLGSPMQALLGALAERGIAPSYLRRLLAAFALADAMLAPEHAAPAATEDAGLLLTPRELEVLHLLDSPLSEKEIAQKLFITVNTVKRHAGSIYQKLGVHSRRHAVARARKLRIPLSPAGYE
jgi:LuxR family maltose regulon positive regulatory protein